MRPASGGSFHGKMKLKETRYIEKDVPQPQALVAFGFSITKRAPINSSEKSIVALARKGSEMLSTTTF
jgi:hypothetical protein